jgi:hypothetical protein
VGKQQLLQILFKEKWAMKKLALFLVLAALICWLPGQAMASTYDLTRLGTDTSSFPLLTDYGDIVVTLTNSTHADITVTTSTGYYFCDSNTYSMVLNVNGAFSATVDDAYKSNSPGKNLDGWRLTTPNNDSVYVANSPDNGNETAFGKFDIATYYSYNNDINNLKNTITLHLSATSGSWDAASDVLALNSQNLVGAAYIQTNVSSGWLENWQQGTVGAAGAAVPLPGAFLLMGAGLVRLTAYARRRFEV